MTATDHSCTGSPVREGWRRSCRYCVPSSSSPQLEETLREKLPAQFGAQPDLLFDPVSGRYPKQHVREPRLKVALL